MLVVCVVWCFARFFVFVCMSWFVLLLRLFFLSSVVVCLFTCLLCVCRLLRCSFICFCLYEVVCIVVVFICFLFVVVYVVVCNVFVCLFAFCCVVWG